MRRLVLVVAGALSLVTPALVAQRPGDSKALAELSAQARRSLATKELDDAERYASETYRLAVAALRTQKLEDDPDLQTALGAAIETLALVQVGRGARSDAVTFLQSELEKYEDSPIHKRLVKNLNLLSLEGQTAPPLVADEYLDRAVPSFAQLNGQVVLMFFWAHWCPDCKAQGPIIAKLLERHRSRGLSIVAPTQRYGYVEGGRNASAQEERRYIEHVRDTYYPFLRNQPVPLNEANHKRYGVASTPTLVLLDRKGVVRLYHPGRMTEAELDAALTRELDRKS
jgi:thiol-disulfide isomerase/thioredoxin